MYVFMSCMYVCMYVCVCMYICIYIYLIIIKSSFDDCYFFIPNIVFALFLSTVKSVQL